MQVFVKGVTSRSERVVEVREGQATVAQHTQIKGGKDGATVAWRSPGLGLVFMLQSERNNVHYTRERLISERGKRK